MSSTPSRQAESAQLGHKRGPSLTSPENVPVAKKSKGKVQAKLSGFMKTDTSVITLLIFYNIIFVLTFRTD